MGASSSVAARQVTPLLLRALATMTGSLHTPSSPHTHPSSSHTRLLCGTVECATLKALDTWFAYRVPSGYLTADGLHPTPFLTTTRTHMPPSRAFFSPTAEWRTLLTGDRRALAELLALDDATARALYINAHAAARLWDAVKAFQRDFFARVLDSDACARGADYLPSADAFDSTDLAALVALAQVPALDGARLRPLPAHTSPPLFP